MMQSFFTLFKQGFVNNFDLILRLKKTSQNLRFRYNFIYVLSTIVAVLDD